LEYRLSYTFCSDVMYVNDAGKSRGNSWMTTKPTEKVKLSSSKINKKEVLTKSSGRILQMAQKTPAKKSVGDDPRFAQAVQNYEAGLRALQEHKFEKAKAALQKVIAGPRKELADRAAVHLSTSNQHLDRVTNQFKSPEEHYDYAISLMNVGDYVVALEHLETLPKQVQTADYVAY